MSRDRQPAVHPLEAIDRPAIYPEHPDWPAVLTAARERVAGHGDLDRWTRALAALPPLTADRIELADAVAALGEAGDTERAALESALRGLHPWRKGPMDLFGLHLDTEWRSDWKWQRIAAAIGDLQGQQVLDVGCGNGYFGWRLLGAGAAGVLGVDPTVLYFLQHLALCRYLGTARPNANRVQSANFLLPIPFESLPVHPFDLVLSMGVIYHRPDPEAHLRQLHDQTRPGGRLLLESLVVTEGPDLTPADSGTGKPGRGRYARMRNVHRVPRVDTLIGWMQAAGFEDIRTLDVGRTTLEEQRSTAWMTFQSLADCLDPEDPSKTVEGYPAPARAALIARRRPV